MHCSFHDQDTLQGDSSRSESRYFAERLCADETFCFCFAHDSSSSEEDEESPRGNDNEAAHGYRAGWNLSDLMIDLMSD